MTDLFARNYSNPLYNSWKDMKKRCSNPSRKDYKWYGGRGITVCKEWENSFSQFAADMAPTWFPGATLGRADGNAHYNVQNCVWQTIQEQQRYRSHRPHVERDAEVWELHEKGFTQAEIGLELGMAQSTVSAKLRGCR